MILGQTDNTPFSWLINCKVGSEYSTAIILLAGQVFLSRRSDQLYLPGNLLNLLAISHDGSHDMMGFATWIFHIHTGEIHNLRLCMHLARHYLMFKSTVMSLTAMRLTPHFSRM
jgi:hypothetical protein